MMSQAGGMDINVLMQRMRRLTMLDASVLDEVRTDTAATVPAIIVAAAATLLFALGGWLWYLFEDVPDTGQFFVRSVILGTIISLIVWGVAIGVTYVMLTQVFRARADLNELVRVLGFAAAPLAIGFLFFIPSIGWGLSIVGLAVMFGLSVVAAQSASDAPPGRTVAAVGVGFLVWAVVLSLLGANADTISDSIVPNIFAFALD